MKACQYYWRNGRVIGRTRAGTMGFDRKKAHNHWPFEQFAQYRLLNSTRKLVLRSREVGFFPSVAGQTFGITGLPDGVYYIEVVANPEGVLHETSTRNDVSLRKVILGGTPGHRTVRVPAWHHLGPEG
jgi:hypothetical protein